MSANLFIYIVVYFVVSFFYLKKLSPPPIIKKILSLTLILIVITFALCFWLKQPLYSEILSVFAERVLVVLSVFLTYLLKFIYSCVDLAHSFPGIFLIATTDAILLLIAALIVFKKPKLRAVFLALLCTLGLIFIFYFLARNLVHFDVEQNKIMTPLSFSIENIIQLGNMILHSVVKNALAARKIIPLIAFLVVIVLAIRKTKCLGAYFTVIGMALALVSQSFLITKDYASAIYLFLVAGIVTLMACLYPSSRPVQKIPLPPSRQIILITLILLVAMTLGLYKLEMYPVWYHPDELLAENKIINSAMKLNRYPSSWQDCIDNIDTSPASFFLWQVPKMPNARPGPYTPIYSYLAYICLKIFPVDFITMRISVVLTGVLSVLFLFLFVRRLFNPQIALLSAFMLAICSWQLVVTRINLPYSVTNLFPLICLYVFWKAIQTRSLTFYLLLGILLTFSVPLYPSIKVLPFLIIVFWVYRCLVERKFLKKHFLGLLIMIGGALIMISAQKIDLLNKLILYDQKAADTVAHDWDYLSFSDGLILAGKGIIISTSTFITRIYNSELFQLRSIGYIERGMLFNFLFLPFFTLGFFWSLFNVKRRNYSFLILWLLFSMAPNIVTGGGKVDRRATLIIAPLMVMAALSIYKFWNLVIISIFKSGKWYRTITTVGLVVFSFFYLSTCSAYYFHTYYLKPKFRTESQQLKKFDRFLGKLLPNHHIYFFSAKGQHFRRYRKNDYIEFRMYSKEDGRFIKHQFEEFEKPSDLIEKLIHSPVKDENFAVIVYTDHEERENLLSELSKLYPHITTYYYEIKPPIFIFEVKKRDINSPSDSTLYENE